MGCNLDPLRVAGAVHADLRNSVIVTRDGDCVLVSVLRIIETEPGGPSSTSPR
jgi:hypothetical protein